MSKFWMSPAVHWGPITALHPRIWPRELITVRLITMLILAVGLSRSPIKVHHCSLIERKNTVIHLCDKMSLISLACLRGQITPKLLKHTLRTRASWKYNSTDCPHNNPIREKTELRKWFFPQWGQDWSSLYFRRRGCQTLAVITVSRCLFSMVTNAQAHTCSHTQLLALGDCGECILLKEQLEKKIQLAAFQWIQKWSNSRHVFRVQIMLLEFSTGTTRLTSLILEVSSHPNPSCKNRTFLFIISLHSEALKSDHLTQHQYSVIDNHIRTSFMG